MAEKRVRLVPLDYTPRTGGTSWALKEGRRALLFDFGADLERQGALLRATRLPDRAGIEPRIELGLLPPIDIYRHDLRLDPNILSNSGDLGTEALLLGHGHVDHFGNLFALRPDIEAHMTSVTAAYLWAHFRCSQGLGAETTHIVERELHPTENGILRKPRDGEAKPRPIRLVDGTPSGLLRNLFDGAGGDDLERSTMQAAGMHFEALPVDHSVLGGCVYVVHTSSGPCAMLTDLRRHGSLAATTDAAIARCAKLGVRAALVDGTCLGREDAPRWTERDCLNRIREIVQGAGRRLVIASLGHRHVERLAAFLSAARSARRTLVVNPRTMLLLEAIGAADAQFDISCLDGLGIYDPPRSTRRSWHSDLRQRRHDLIVTPEEIRKDPHRFIVTHELGTTADWLEYQPHGAIFVYAGSAAFDDEARGRHASLEEWLRLFRISAEGIMFSSRGCEYDPRLNPSGHLHQKDLEEIVDHVRPEILIPIHTERPEAFRSFLPSGCRLAVPKAGQSIWL